MLAILFVDPEVFVSQENGLSLSSETLYVKKPVPKQFPSLSSYEFAVVAGSTVQAAANTAFLSQFGVTICLAVSLKAMWNLMHVMQVMTYLRLLVPWPANSQMMLQSLHNAITLENVINSVYDSLLIDLNQLVSADDADADRMRKEKDIPYSNIVMSLGIFGIGLGVLLLILLVYVVIKLMTFRFPFCGRVREKLRGKLFYSVWIRYMIESYLKMSHNCIFFIYISASLSE